VTALATFNNRLATGSRDHKVLVGKLASDLKLSQRASFDDHMNSVTAIHMDENLLITASADWTVNVYNFALS